MCWASDNPELLAIMEKGRMVVFRGTEAEEPVVSSAWLAGFKDLQVSLHGLKTYGWLPGQFISMRTVQPMVMFELQLRMRLLISSRKAFPPQRPCCQQNSLLVYVPSNKLYMTLKYSVDLACMPYWL